MLKRWCIGPRGRGRQRRLQLRMYVLESYLMWQIRPNDPLHHALVDNSWSLDEISCFHCTCNDHLLSHLKQFTRPLRGITFTFTRWNILYWTRHRRSIHIGEVCSATNPWMHSSKESLRCDTRHARLSAREFVKVKPSFAIALLSPMSTRC